MKVKLVKYSKGYYWYKDKVGEIFEVEDSRFDNDCYEIKGSYKGIYKEDTILVNEIKYESRDGVLKTECPAGFSQMVGSLMCCNCSHNCKSDLINRVVLCSWQKEEEDKMKRLDIRKEYRDGNILVIPIIHEEDYLLISTHSNKHETATIRVGKDYLTSLTKVNAVLKALELPYELYESVDWNKVEEGTDVLVLDKKGIIDGYRGKFIKYIADIKKLVVRVGDEVYIVEEDKVELCN